MSLPIVWWPVIPETLEARLAQAEADARFAEQWEIANFGSSAESMAHALWGIWEIPIDEWLSTVQDVRNMEAWDRENPDLILAQLDDWWETIRDNRENPDNMLTDIIETPFIERLIHDEVISGKLGRYIQEELQAWWYFPDIIRSIEWDNPNNEQRQAIIDTWWVMNSEEWTEQFAQDFERDFGNQFTDRINGEFSSSLQQDAYDMVASSYMIWESHETWDIQIALDMAFRTAANSAISGRVFHRTEYFETRLDEVRDVTLSVDERLQSLTEILAIVHTDQWWKWNTIREANRRVVRQRTLQQAWLNFEFSQTQEQLLEARRQNNRQQEMIAQTQLRILLEQASEITWTPIWDFDISLEWDIDPSNENPQEA